MITKEKASLNSAAGSGFRDSLRKYMTEVRRKRDKWRIE